MMPTFQRILCPVDLSEFSRHALREAAVLAASAGAQLTIQYVYVPMFVPVPTLPVPGDRVPAGEAERTSAELQAFGAAAGCPPGTAAVVDVGRPSFEILKRASEDHADLIVIGTHGASGFTHLVLGSVAERVLRQAPCPVLTVPPLATQTPAAPFRRIVCAVDFSEWSVAALNLAVSLARAAGAELVAVHTIEWPWPEPPAPVFIDLPPAQATALLEFRRYTSARALARLEDLVHDVAAGTCDVTAEVVHGKPRVELVRVAAAKKADLIVLGVHGRSMLDMALFGSTTNQVVRHAACPVLTVRR